MNRNFYAFLDVNPCLKFARRAFRGFFAWSFSMLSEPPFLMWLSPAQGRLFFDGIDGGDCLG